MMVILQTWGIVRSEKGLEQDGEGFACIVHDRGIDIAF